MKVFSNQTDDGASKAFHHYGNNNLVNLFLYGDFGGGVVKAQALVPDRSEWIDIDGGEWTTPGMKIMQAAPVVIRLVLEGSAGADLNASINTDGWAPRRAVEAPVEE